MHRLLLICALCAFASAQLYGVTKDNQLVILNSELSGVWTTIGSPFAMPQEFVTLVQVADIDINNATLYIIGINRTSSSQYLVGLNINNGKIASRHKLPFKFTFDFVSTPGLDWIPDTDDLLIYGANSNGMYTIYRVTPATGTFVQITQFNDPNHVLESIDTFDSVNNLLWIQVSGYRELRNMAFDITTGALVYNLTDLYGVMSLNFNPVDGLVYGVASNQQYGTMLVTISSITGQYAIVGTLTNVGISSVAGPQDAGLDYNTGNLYVYLSTLTNDSLFVDIPIQNPSNWNQIPSNSIVPATIVYSNQ